MCASEKQPEKIFNLVEKKTNLLELIYSNIYDSNNVLTRDGKRYFIIFINDFSRYY